MKTHRIGGEYFVRSLVATTVVSCLLISPPVFSQAASATLRGQVSAAAGPVADAQVRATNTATGYSRTVPTGSSGNYTLAGLPPGTYQVEVVTGSGTLQRLVTLQVGQTATLDLGVVDPSETVESVVVTATQLFETQDIGSRQLRIAAADRGAAAEFAQLPGFRRYRARHPVRHQRRWLEQRDPQRRTVGQRCQCVHRWRRAEELCAARRGERSDAVAW